ncbi:hypothetical protein OPT61_g10411 [Boeremia exigua]|uniref:Uncharacterized protein n=1 Tax=Boeremia exigua TaxID=749465 RepID=A0ACC2HQM1_9PLEO|nr:hypothetical protein OPT61_g10411 [Boeremia exigua]
MAELERRNKQAEEELRRMAEKEERQRLRAERKMSTDDREHRSFRRKDSQRESRPHNERRRSHQAETEDERRRRHDERRATRRASEYPTPVNGEPVADYFDPRNADAAGSSHRSKHRSSRRGADDEQNQPYLNKGPDKTSSWVQSLSDDNPLPVPIAETILDPPPGSRDADLVDEETPSQDEDIRLRIAGRRGPKRDKERAERHAERDRDRDRERDKDRDRKQHRRRSYYEDEDEPRSAKRDSRRKTYDPYDQPVRTWDGRPEGETPRGVKRGSWLKKIAGLG